MLGEMRDHSSPSFLRWGACSSTFTTFGYVSNFFLSRVRTYHRKDMHAHYYDSKKYEQIWANCPNWLIPSALAPTLQGHSQKIAIVTIISPNFLSSAWGLLLSTSRWRVFWKLSWGCQMTCRRNIFNLPTSMRSPQSNGQTTRGSCFSSNKSKCRALDWQLCRRRRPTEFGRYRRQTHFKMESSSRLLASTTPAVQMLNFLGFKRLAGERYVIKSLKYHLLLKGGNIIYY